MSKLAICHLLIVLAFILIIFRQWHAAGLLSLCVGVGGVGAGWSRWTEANGGWLDISAAFLHYPGQSVATCLIEHAPFIPIGIVLLFLF